MARNPLYVDRGGEQAIRHPIALSGATLQGFVLDAQLDALTALIDRQLNVPAAGAVRYLPLAPRVMLIYASMARAQSLDARDRELGWTPEIDVGFWVPMLRLGDGLPRLTWYLPYVFVDTSYAMAIGRENFGFHKQVSQPSFSGALPQVGPLSVTATAIPRQGFSAQFTPHKLFEARRVVTRGGAAGGTRFGSVAEVGRELLGRLLGGLPALSIPGLGSFDVLGSLVPDVSLTFLKEFRDIAEPLEACSLAVCEAPARATGFRGAGLLDEDWEVEVPHFDSHPIARDLGLTTGVQPGRHAFWVDFDFEMHAGTVLHEAKASPTSAAAGTAPRQKIAVLGGGCGGMTAAYLLTERPGWERDFEVTVYQQGWRLGGTGASGRNPAHAERIEEHGLHVWMGFYENAFAVMRRCYAELGRPPEAPLATWDQAWKPHNLVVLMEKVRGEWTPWPFEFPALPGLPGDGVHALEPVDYVQKLLESMAALWKSVLGEAGLELDELPRTEGLLGFIGDLLRSGAAAVGAFELAGGMMARALERLRDWALGGGGGGGGARVEDALDVLDSLTDWLAAAVLPRFPALDSVRRGYILLDLMTAIVRGIIFDAIPLKGWHSIDDEDFADWLARHGAAPMTVDSGVVRGIYQLVFAYPRGDTSQPGRFAAGVATRGLLRMVYTYEHAVFWEMQAGMGDTVFAPMYEVLRRRGVKFEFMHRVERLELTADRSAIGAVHLTRQATPRDSVRGYDPLVTIKDLPCWPSTPRWSELVEGAELEARGVDLESPWSDWPGVGTRTLRAGVDFDRLVLGIPVGALGGVCSELIAADARWAAMVRGVTTVQTQAMQLWLSRTPAELGWKLAPPVLDAYEDPFNTWADLSHLLQREAWPAAATPAALAYLCGPLLDLGPTPPPGASDFQARQSARVKELAMEWLDTYIGGLWPGATKFPDGRGGFEWDHLHDPAGGSGRARFDSQYWRANVSPTERYVLSEPGSIGLRMRADESGFANLVLAGDWLRTGMDAGCVEAAVMGGMQASRALCGYPEKIHGDE
ncbi:MAG: NAD(P)-binding protein [Deltaproteobacteria bacterium]|nr:NAD(P)-binding protein [Deltaproteobacteria bacterium]